MKLNIKDALLVVPLVLHTTRASSVAHETSQQIDLAAAIDMSLTPDIGLPDSISTVARTMQSVNNMPSCAKVASAALLNSCAQLDSDAAAKMNEGLDIMLDKSKSIYATRLAVCEILDVGAHITSACSTFKPKTRNSRTSGFTAYIRRQKTSPSMAHYDVYDQETIKQLDSCKATLHATPQSWTSFSNARQNAVVMCNAMRAEVERDDAIAFHKIMMEYHENATSNMGQASDILSSVLTNFKSVRQGMESFHTELSKDNEAMSAAVAEQWSRIRQALDSIHDGITTAQQATHELNADLDGYKAQSDLIHESSVTAFKDTQHRLKHAQELVSDLQARSQASLASQMEMDETVNTLHMNTVSAAEVVTYLRTIVEDVQMGLMTINVQVNNTQSALSSLRADLGPLQEYAHLFSNVFGSGQSLRNAFVRMLLWSTMSLIMSTSISMVLSCRGCFRGQWLRQLILSLSLSCVFTCYLNWCIPWTAVSKWGYSCRDWTLLALPICFLEIVALADDLQNNRLFNMLYCSKRKKMEEFGVDADDASAGTISN
ncbi:hypothetical protein AAFC00_004171 [Neodothiora populina]|uniref:Nuclear fusion protein KAR5 n=1 Tax=Neodothiora populina TaxID=2781224 RepID=A0ABR3PIS7_9PEZI